MRSVKNKVEYGNWSEVERWVLDQVRVPVWDEVEEQVRDRVRDQIRDRVRDRVEYQAWREAEDNAKR